MAKKTLKTHISRQSYVSSAVAIAPFSSANCITTNLKCCQPANFILCDITLAASIEVTGIYSNCSPLASCGSNFFAPRTETC